MINEDLHLTLVQTGIHWEDREANLDMLSDKIAAIEEPTDLILLPEMFTTGFSMHPEKFAETMDGAAIEWMRETASVKKAVICGSLMMRDGNSFYNRLVWMRPDRTFEQYDKRHLFGLGEEHNHYSAGDQRLITQLKGWKIFPLICYDLRFPVWCRNTYHYDMLIFVASWPERRIHAWKTLLEARAIENQCYVAGVNRVGPDGNSNPHTGESSVIDPRGEVFWREAHREVVHTCTLSYHHLSHIRESLPFLKDQDQFTIRQNERAGSHS